MLEATVAAIITRNVSNCLEVLLTNRNVEPFKGQWCLPGGHIDSNESTKDAIIRGVKEETDLNFKPVFFEYFDEIIPELKIHAVLMVFEGQSKGVLKINKDEVSDIKWFSVAEAQSLPLAFSHNEVLQRYLSVLK